MTELQMIMEIRPDAALPEPGELAVARSRLTAAIAAADVAGPAPAAGPKRSRHYRPRRVALVAAAVTGGAAIAAAAVLVATAGPGRVPGAGISPGPGTSPRPAISPLPPRTAALVISRTEQALTSAERRNLIQEIHAVGQADLFTLPPGHGRAASAARAVIRTYRGLIVTEGLTATGQRIFDASFRYGYAPHRLTISSETVNDAAKTWWRGSFPIHMRGRPVPIWLPPQSCPAAALPSPSGSFGSNWPAEIRLALRCGQYHVAGTGWVDGISAIKIVPKYSRPPHGVHLMSQVLWVSRSTYLPVRVRWSWPRGHGLPRGSLTGDFTWLLPTKANLASLRVTIPPGYRQLPPDGLGGVDFQMAPGFVSVVWPLG
jgi:hypothetical protein